MLAGLCVLGGAPPTSVAAGDPCAAPVTNPVACENTKPGTPGSDWQVNGVGDASIQGFATSMSVAAGQTVTFKIKTPSTSYHLDVLRLGYYQGNGARKVAAGIRPSASLPQTQPACVTQASTGLIDCGNWGTSASWTVPAGAVSGVYVAHLVRDDVPGDSQIPFVVRNDSSRSDLLVSTSDATWEAYNAYGGNSLYQCTVACPPGNPKAYKAAYAVSYNRPFDGALVADRGRSYLYYAEYQMIQFLERNGYDVSYASQGDVDANGALLTNHKVFVSSGHDEYWSGAMRANVEAARDAGVSLAFFSGNEVFWKTRFAASADGSNTPGRTLVTYKETHFDASVDPQGPSVWTGTWIDPRFSPPGDGGRPQNSLTGQLFLVNAGTSDIKVPSQYSQLRLWRNTAAAGLAPGQSLTLGAGIGTLGYEWDVDPDNGFRPAGLLDMSSTTVAGAETFTDYGSTTTTSTATHHLTLYRAPSGALVFGAGTVQWAWGLDTSNPWSVSGPPSLAPDRNMQQATVNLLADMGSQPASLATGLTAAAASTDGLAPSSVVVTPTAGSSIKDGTLVTVSGTASDVGGVVAGVEVSTDGGTTWHPASGTGSWTYSWVAHGAPTATIMSRATDDSGNVQLVPGSLQVGITCSCSLWGSSVTPETVDSGDPSAVEVGVRFKADLVGTVTGIRFYKASTNTGTHVGNLWKADGTLLARGTFTGETASGWQTLTFATPVTINANTTYVASYFAPVGHYSSSADYFYVPSPLGGNTLDSPPLHALRANGGIADGVFSYVSGTSFPGLSGDGTNYGVDLAFTPSPPPGQVTNATATAGSGSATVSWAAPAAGGPVTDYTVTPFVGATPQPATTVSGTPPATGATIGGLDAGTAYTFTVRASNPNGAGPPSAASDAVTPTDPVVPAAPTGVVATTGNGRASVRWTAPADGGRTIVSYTITPFVNGLAQPVTTVFGSPAATSATVPNLTNGTPYTFAVTATNAIGAGPQSAQSNSVTPGPAPLFVQRVSARNPSGPSVALTPASNVTTNDRLVVMAGVWSGAGAGVSNVTDSAGNAYAKVTSFRAPDNTEMSIWSAPITSGGGARPTITVTASGTADIGAAALEYSGLSTAAGAAAVDKLATAVGTSAAAGLVASGATAPTSADNELAVGFYADSGFGNPLTADAGFAERVNVSPTPDMEFVAEDTLANRGDTPNARVGTGANTPWLMATVVFKSGQTGPATAPSPPTGVTATAGDASAKVSWSAPSDGGSPITGYAITPYIGSTPQGPPVTTAASASSATIAGLANGTAYSFRVTASNAIGTSPASAASNSVTPTAPAAPQAPTGVTAAAGNGRASVNWTAPADNGSAITSYRITPYIGSAAQTPTTVTGSPPATAATVTGLTNGTVYTFTVRAVNAVGTGPESQPSSAVTPAASTTPAFVQQTAGRTLSPSLVLTPAANVASGDRLVVQVGIWSAAGATASRVSDAAGNTYVKLTGFKAADGTEMSVWSAPVSSGGGTRPAVTVTASGTADIGAAVVEYSGLSPAPDATAVDRIATAVGKTSAAASVASGATAATGADNELAVGFYTDSGFGNALTADPAFAERVNVSPQNDMEFVVEDRLVSAGATANATARTGANTTWLMATVVFKTAAPVIPVAPGAPTSTSATAGDGKATVSWTAPPDGGSPITSYTVTPFVGSVAQPSTTVTGAPPATSTTVSGLTNGTAYTFKVTATNTIGTSPASTASAAVTPSAPTAPGTPASVTAAAGNGRATVSWTAPPTGGSPITSYAVTPYAGATALPPVTITGSPPATTATVTGLTNGTAYTFTVTAVNAVGSGAESAPSSAVTPTATVAPVFVQQISKRVLARTDVLTPASNVAAGDRLVVMAGVWSASKATISGVTDAAGNIYSKVTSFKASDDTEMSVWTAPIAAGGGTRPAITVTATGTADIGAAVAEYSGLSAATGLASVDRIATATGKTTAAATVASGPTLAVTADNELAVGFYADSGFSANLVADAAFTPRVNVSPTGDMELLVEDRVVGAGATPSATVRTGANTPWLMSTVVFRNGG